MPSHRLAPLALGLGLAAVPVAADIHPFPSTRPPVAGPSPWIPPSP